MLVLGHATGIPVPLSYAESLSCFMQELLGSMEHVEAFKAKAIELGHVVKAKAQDLKEAAGPYANSLKDTAGRWGHGMKDTAGHVGHGLKEAACHFGEGTWDNAGKLGHGLRDAAGHVGHGMKETAGHWGHGTKVAGGFLHDKTAEMTKSAEAACKSTFDSETELHKWLEGVKPGYGRCRHRLKAV